MRLKFGAVCACVIISAASVFAQGEPAAEKQAVPSDVVQPAPQTPPQAQPSEPKEEPQKISEPQQPKAPEKAMPSKEKDLAQKPSVVTPAQIPPQVNKSLNGLSLIEINDGNFRYTRIEGMTFQKKDVNIAKNETDAKKIIDNSLGKGGWKASVMVWISIVGTIILVFILYRYGRKKRKGRVFRRFP